MNTPAQPARPQRPPELAQCRAHAGRRILVADDNLVNQQVAIALLEAAGLHVDVADDGQQAIERLQAGHYDLVLMDLQMPVLDGLAATRAIRALPALARLPILAMTAHAFAAERQACLDAGMDDHVCKPIDPSELYGKLTQWLQRGR